MDWAIPWSTPEVIDFIFLVVSTAIVTSVPVIYGVRANFHDPLARAVVAGTGATALAFLISLIFTVALHAGWQPSASTGHWIARGIYSAVALGKLLLLVALLRVLHAAKVSGNRGKAMDGVSM